MVDINGGVNGDFFFGLILLKNKKYINILYIEMAENNEVKIKVKKTANMKQYMKDYMRTYTNNKESVECACGGVYKPHQMHLHVKTKIHSRYLTNKQASDIYKQYAEYENETLIKVNELMDKMELISEKLQSLNIQK
jgi:uncharacterized protein YfaQ (DUF2300 family)